MMIGNIFFMFYMIIALAVTGLAIYVMILLIKALNIYIRKNSTY